MPYLVDCKVHVDGTEITEHCYGVDIPQEADDVNVDTMGTRVHRHLAGLRNDHFELRILPDTGGVVDGVFRPLLATSTEQPVFRVEVENNQDGSTYSCDDCILLTYNPISGDVGNRSEMTVTIPCNSEIVKGSS
jgi:hypothetical protein